MLATIDHSGFDVAIHENSGNVPDWTNIYTFADQLDTEVVNEALLTIAKCGYVVKPDSPESGLWFRTRGFMDEAIGESVQKMQPLLDQFVMPTIIKVELFSPDEARKSTEDDKDFQIYNVTSTILSMLTQKHI